METVTTETGSPILQYLAAASGESMFISLESVFAKNVNQAYIFYWLVLIFVQKVVKEIMTKDKVHIDWNISFNRTRRIFILTTLFDKSVMNIIS